jgi:hypothetical protein
MDLEILLGDPMTLDITALERELEKNYFVGDITVRATGSRGKGATVVVTTSDPGNVDEEKVCSAFERCGTEVDVFQTVSRTRQ